MKWWQSDPLSGHILEALIHINHSIDIQEYASSTNICKILFDALNKLQIEHNQVRGVTQQREVKSFKELIMNGLPKTWRNAIINSKELADLVDLEPKILNHSILKKYNYQPGKSIEHTLAKKASETHKKLNNAYIDYSSTPSPEIQDRVIKRMAELLYVVRSNIAHGEKTPYGPDQEKIKRDEIVSGLIIPLQLNILKLIFDRPDYKLLVYGTLAPGEPNHFILEGINGEWINCKIHGKIKTENDFPCFKWDPSSSKITVKLFKSESLPDLWDELDQFEGSYYRRHMIPAQVEGDWEISYVYEKSS